MTDEQFAQFKHPECARRRRTQWRRRTDALRYRPLQTVRRHGEGIAVSNSPKEQDWAICPVCHRKPDDGWGPCDSCPDAPGMVGPFIPPPRELEEDTIERLRAEVEKLTKDADRARELLHEYEHVEPGFDSLPDLKALHTFRCVEESEQYLALQARVRDLEGGLQTICQMCVFAHGAEEILKVAVVTLDDKMMPVTFAK